MGTIIDILNNWGYWGMFLTAFLSGSLLPFSSTTLLIAFLAAGLKPWELLIWASVGNLGGSMLNYYIGTVSSTNFRANETKSIHVCLVLLAI